MVYWDKENKGLLNKIELIEFLQSLDVNDIIIKKIEEFPDNIKIDGVKYYFYSYISPIDINNKYNFELNYYSFDELEFLFGHKMFSDIETSIYTLFYCLSGI